MNDIYERKHSTIDGNIIYEWPDSKSTSVLVFIHGFKGHPSKTWGQLPKLIAGTTYARNKDVVLVNYKSGIFGRSKSISTILDEIATFIESKLYKYNKIFIIGHSLGGVLGIALPTILKGKDIKWASRIRGIILLAPALWGSYFANAIKLWNQLGSQLVPGARELTNIIKDWQDYRAKNGIQAFYIKASNDKIVLFNRAAENAFEYQTINRNHISVSKVNDITDLLFITIINILYKIDGSNYFDSRAYLLQVVYDSSPEDWQYEPETEEYIYLPMHELRIENSMQLIDSYEERWTKYFPDHSASMDEYKISYKGLWIKKLKIVSTDGGRYAIPLPTVVVGSPNSQYLINRNEYKIGLIMARSGFYNSFEDGFRISQITLDG